MLPEHLMGQRTQPPQRTNWDIPIVGLIVIIGVVVLLIMTHGRG